MADIIRSAKSGSAWTSIELLAYNIIVHPQPSAVFFGREPNAPLDNLDQHFVSDSLDHYYQDQADISDNTFRLLRYLRLATRANAGQESAIDDLAKGAPAYAIPLTICGDSEHCAQTDVCLIHDSGTILLVVQEDKDPFTPKDHDPRVIAAAIAAFQYNNWCARAAIGEPPLDAMIIPCIMMVGTRPVFYQVPVTTALSSAVIGGQYPKEATHVTTCVVSPSQCFYEGMEVPSYRKIALQHLAAFKVLAKLWWQKFLV
ncbi:hypothetical protein FISHEDRAFT_63643 [Fistulina hepatica ATCC 64428]|uniref:Uncharacterized protein n=1 Tax=Fistulina hepatica ATCC 64428 TaxID=1128425 RepID=A0A0D7AM38_9AGAR|nr:hypothetical protein FISHEDRAFT_63643 [Fistulina hepatica ATCC 64428]